MPSRNKHSTGRQLIGWYRISRSLIQSMAFGPIRVVGGGKWWKCNSIVFRLFSNRHFVGFAPPQSQSVWFSWGVLFIYSLRAVGNYLRNAIKSKLASKSMRCEIDLLYGWDGVWIGAQKKLLWNAIISVSNIAETYVWREMWFYARFGIYDCSIPGKTISEQTAIVDRAMTAFV